MASTLTPAISRTPIRTSPPKRKGMPLEPLRPAAAASRCAGAKVPSCADRAWTVSSRCQEEPRKTRDRQGEPLEHSRSYLFVRLVSATGYHLTQELSLGPARCTVDA